ncbi:MAG: type II toxin-antitoxin system HicA family toxin [Kiloniellaceae bacterium]
MAAAIRPFAEEHNKSVAHNSYVSYLLGVNAQEFRRWLKKRGCAFETHKGGSGHLTVRRGSRTSQLPMHGSRKELGPKLVKKIKKDLGLE